MLDLTEEEFAHLKAAVSRLGQFVSSELETRRWSLPSDSLYVWEAEEAEKAVGVLSMIVEVIEDRIKQEGYDR